METFLEYETMCREPPPGHVFVGSLAEIDPRKVAEVVRALCHIRSLQYLAIQSDIGSPIIKRIIETTLCSYNKMGVRNIIASSKEEFL